MGGGDIKLAAMFGALLGPLGAFATITLAAFAGAVAVEVVLKQIVERGPLELDGRHLEVYDHAFPSGHATRTTFLFLVAALVWPRARAWLALWMTAVVVALVLDGWHVPTDVAGGMLLAAALVLALSPQPVTAPEPSASSSTARSRSD
jgi:membrane-associated phospholipid phosphatase